MKTNYSKYCNIGLKVEGVIKNVYGDFFRRRSNHHNLFWDFQKDTNLFGKETVSVLHLYSDCPGILIGYKGETIDKFKSQLKEVNPNIEIRIHDCEKIYK